jgi:hypothetical protein
MGLQVCIEGVKGRIRKERGWEKVEIRRRGRKIQKEKPK